MKKVIIQIPCYNEEETLGAALKSLPRSLPGIDRVEWLVINDGSTDKTVEVAKSEGVDHIINLTNHQGLAKAFMAGIEASLIAGADIIVNTDADNQYCADDIPKLIGPISEGKADIVIGERPISQIEHFSFFKKSLEKIGSWVVRIASNTNIPDAPSGCGVVRTIRPSGFSIVLSFFSKITGSDICSMTASRMIESNFFSFYFFLHPPQNGTEDTFFELFQ